MSRLNLVPKNPKRSIMVGFDSILESYFIFVEETTGSHLSGDPSYLVRAQDGLQDLRSMNSADRYKRSDVIRAIKRFALENRESNQVVEKIAGLQDL